MEAREEAGLSKSTAVLSCTAMALFYVGILYSPTLILRLPQPSSFKEFLLRRFVCAAISSVVSIAACALVLPVGSKGIPSLLGVYGIRMDHIWQAMVYPLCLTSLMYAGSMVLKFLLVVESMKEHMNQGGSVLDGARDLLQNLGSQMSSMASNVLFWRNLIVVSSLAMQFSQLVIYIFDIFRYTWDKLPVFPHPDARYGVLLRCIDDIGPVTEELVFRACMIPLLLCGGFEPYIVICLCPILFSLAHLNHWMEIYCQQNYSVIKASMVVGLQLGYTVIFGSYASFLFIRTGHLVGPLLAHVFCNYMGLPMFFSRTKGMVVTLAFAAGAISFVWLLSPLTRPDLYHERTDDCRCWHGYCSWN